MKFVSSKRLICLVSACLVLAFSLMCFVLPAVAEGNLPAAQGETTAQETEAAEPMTKSAKALSAAIAIGLAAAGGAVAMGIAIAKAVEGIARQPEAEGKIRTSLMLGLVFVETAIIYALIIAILIIFVL